MVLPASVFPGALWDGNEQDTSNDNPGDDTISNAADYNETSAEAQAAQSQLRAGVIRAFRNNTGVTLNAGDLVHVTGFDSGTGLPTVTKSRSDVLGTLAEYVVIANVLNNANGNIANRYVIASLNTSAFSAGDEVYLDASTAGSFTAVAPSVANFAQYVGKVTKVNATTGEVEFNISRPAVPDKSTLEYGAVEILRVKNSGITAAKLANAVADAILTQAAITKDAEGTVGADIIRFTIQLRDAQGNNLAKQKVVYVWLAETSFGPADATSVTAFVATGAGTLIEVLTADASAKFLTDAAGLLEVDVTVTGAKTKHFQADVGDQARTLSATWAA